MGRIVVGSLALGGMLAFGSSARALSVSPVNLAEMIRQSGQIIYGTVAAVSQGIDESGLPYTEVQVAVDETIRGAEAGTLTFRQFGLQREPASERPRFFRLDAGMPHYNEGEQVMLFLTPTSAIGFRTTVGLDQGRFVLGLGTLKNGANNAGLFQNVDLTKVRLDAIELLLVSSRQGELDADTFVAFVRRAVRENWWN
jgi:hypothetical protein